jgi:hypothetical protein
MSMNAERRRRQQDFERSVQELGRQAKNGMVQNFTCTPFIVVTNPILRAHLMVWADEISRASPMICLGCNRHWKSFAQHPPALFNFLGPCQTDDQLEEQWLMSAVCQRCAERPDLNNRVAKVLRKIWPDLKIVHVHEPPRSVS